MKKELKVVVDINIFLSALIGNGSASKIYKAFAKGYFTPLFSLDTREELFEVIQRNKFRRYFGKEETEKLKDLIKKDSILVIPQIKVDACRDPKDNPLLETAIEGKADFVVTSDKDLLVLNPFRNISIVSPQEFIKILFKF